MEITIVDLGAGNLRSVTQALWRAGAEAVATSDPDRVRRAERLVLPGVGAAGPALQKLRAAGLDAALEDVRRAGRPILGICLGMQIMAQTHLEFGSHRGLGWIKGQVEALDPVALNVRVPHIGWNEIEPHAGATSLLGSARRDRFFYFCHSYVLSAEPGVAAASVTYGRRFTCAIQVGSVYATQFHPEKSDLAGQKLLERFIAWRP